MDVMTNIKTMDTVLEKAKRIGVLAGIINQLNYTEEQSKGQFENNSAYFFQLTEIIKEQSNAIIAIVQQISFTAILERETQSKILQEAKKAA